MGIIRIVIIFLLIYFGFRFLFRVVLPFFASLVAREMKDQINRQQEKRENSVNKKKDDDKGQYIDYEEVKEK